MWEGTKNCKNMAKFNLSLAPHLNVDGHLRYANLFQRRHSNFKVATPQFAQSQIIFYLFLNLETWWRCIFFEMTSPLCREECFFAKKISNLPSKVLDDSIIELKKRGKTKGRIFIAGNFVDIYGQSLTAGVNYKSLMRNNTQQKSTQLPTILRQNDKRVLTIWKMSQIFHISTGQLLLQCTLSMAF